MRTVVDDEASGRKWGSAGLCLASTDKVTECSHGSSGLLVGITDLDSALVALFCTTNCSAKANEKTQSADISTKPADLLGYIFSAVHQEKIILFRRHNLQAWEPLNVEKFGRKGGSAGLCSASTGKVTECSYGKLRMVVVRYSRLRRSWWLFSAEQNKMISKSWNWVPKNNSKGCMFIACAGWNSIGKGICRRWGCTFNSALFNQQRSVRTAFC